MSENQMNNGMVAGFLLGAVVGAGMALLMAPQTGSETRRRLKDAARDLGENSRSVADDAGRVLRDGLHDAKDKVENLKSKLTRGVHEAKQDVTDAIDAGRDAARGY